jgi:hypothetical protein
MHFTYAESIVDGACVLTVPASRGTNFNEETGAQFRENVPSSFEVSKDQTRIGMTVVRIPRDSSYGS